MILTQNLYSKNIYSKKDKISKYLFAQGVFLATMQAENQIPRKVALQMIIQLGSDKFIIKTKEN